MAAHCPHCNRPIERALVGAWPPVPTRCPECARYIGRNRARLTRDGVIGSGELGARSPAAPGAAGEGRAPAPAKPGDRALLIRIFREARGHWASLAGLFSLELLATPLLLLMPIPLKVAVDSVIGTKPLPGLVDSTLPSSLLSSDSRVLIVSAVLLVLVVVLGQAQEVASYVLRTRTGERLTLGFRRRLFRHVQRLSLTFHDSRGTADSIYRIQYDAPAIQYVTVYGVLSAVSAGFTVVTALVVTALIDWQLALVALAVAPLLFLSFRAYNRRMRPRYVDAKQLESDALQVVQEVLSAFRVVKAFGREDHEERRFGRRAGVGIRAKIRLARAEGAFGALVNITAALGTAAVLYIGARNVKAGMLTLGELLMVITYLSQLYSPLKNMSKQVSVVQSSLASAERAFELLDAIPDVRERPGARPLKRASGGIELRDVAFSYDGEHPVLRDLTLSIPPGARVGVSGRTGAGKTTFVSLLTRLHDPTDGQLLLDGVDLRDYRLADLRDQFAVVLQEPVLFSTTIAENIAYARGGERRDQSDGAGRAGLPGERRGRADADVVAAAKAANAHDFITRLPDGYQTLVGERGMRLSGGERQRIALARAFLKDAPILILDEPTSSVDTATEAGIVEAMERLMAGRTTIMIAHRIGTLNGCDIRLELDEGRVRRLEEGEVPQSSNAQGSEARAPKPGPNGSNGHARGVPDLGDPRYLHEVGWFLYHERFRRDRLRGTYDEERMDDSRILLREVLAACGRDEEWLAGQSILSIGAGCTGDLCAWPAAAKVSADPLVQAYGRLGMLLADAPGTPPTQYLPVGAEELPLVDACMDLVLCRNALDHMPRPELALEELGRVLRPGGLIFLSVDIGGVPTPDEPTVFTVESLLELVGSYFELVYESPPSKPHSKGRELSLRLVARRDDRPAPSIDKESLLEAYLEEIG